jgi:uncharacterized RDD family membrane protein YckC
VRRPPLSVSAPLRILGMVSNPEGTATLDVEGEKVQLAEACRPLIDEGLLEIDWVERATLKGLNDSLNDGEYHIFHFVGHGDFDSEASDGVLLFEAPAGRVQRVPSNDLATILADHDSLRLAVINACEGARVAPDSSGIANSLMSHGLPAVIAMQFEISDAAALGFARGFYASLAKSHPIDKALTDARRGMFSEGHGLEWATPVLFTSVDDSILFELNVEQNRVGGADRAPGASGRRPPQRVREPPERAKVRVRETEVETKDSIMDEADEARVKEREVYRPPPPPPPPPPSRPARADLGTRTKAALCDWFLLLLLYVVLGATLKEAGALLALLLGAAYYVYFEGTRGQTLGKQWLNVRVVSVEGDTSIGFKRASIRLLGRYLSALVVGVGYLWMVIDPERQCWHDKLAKTVVVPVSAAPIR